MRHAFISVDQLRKRTVEGYLKSRKGKSLQAANLHRTFQLESDKSCNSFDYLKRRVVEIASKQKLLLTGPPI